MSAAETSNFCMNQRDWHQNWMFIVSAGLFMPEAYLTVGSLMSVFTVCFSTHRTWPCSDNTGVLGFGVFPLQGLTLYPISMCSITRSGMTILLGIMFYRSSLIENCWMSAKKQKKNSHWTIILFFGSFIILQERDTHYDNWKYKI